jgi:zeaxanthin glucosyltransferase
MRKNKALDPLLQPLRLLLLVDSHFGHFRAMVGLAQQLQARGHVVQFACPDPTFAARMAAAGWPSLIAPWLASSLAPPGIQPTAAKIAARLTEVPAQARQLYRDFAWDLALIDPFLLWAYPYLCQLGACAAVSTKPLLTPDPLVPPWTSGLVPQDAALSRARIQLCWLQTRLGYVRYRLQCHLDQWRHGVSHRTLAAEACKQAGHDPGDWSCRPIPIDMRYRSAGELILHAREFDLPRRRPLEPGVAYLGPCLDTGVTQSGRVPRDHAVPLIVCSLGTEMPAQAALKRYRAVIAAMEHLPAARLVISAGSVERAEQLGIWAQPFGTQVRIEPWIDLGQDLRRAAAAILHGGANSAKEAIAARCPILLLPARADQPGIAARCVFHGLGKTVTEIEPIAIARALSTMLTDQTMATQLDRMALCFERYATEQTASRVIERLVQERRPKCPPRAA